MYIQRLITVFEPDLDGMPAQLRRVLSEADCEVIRSGPQYFEKLAKRGKYAWLRRTLQRSARCDGWYLEFTSVGKKPLMSYFRLYWGGHPGLCLPRGGRLPAGLPPVLKHFYSL